MLKLPIDSPDPTLLAMNTPDQSLAFWGFAEFFSETGTEGGHWAAHDVRSVDASRYGSSSSRSYGGLHVLDDGDHITLFAPESLVEGPELGWEPRVLWQGIIRLKEHPLCTEHVHGLWVHADVEGADREQFGEWFLAEVPCLCVPEGASAPGETQPPAEMLRILQLRAERARNPLLQREIGIRIDETYPEDFDREAHERFVAAWQKIADDLDRKINQSGGTTNGWSYREKLLYVGLVSGTETMISEHPQVAFVRPLTPIDWGSLFGKQPRALKATRKHANAKRPKPTKRKNGEG